MRHSKQAPGLRLGGALALLILIPACGVSGGGTLSPTSAPGIPSQVTVLPGNGSLTLSWIGTPAALSYNVSRSAQPVGPFLPVAAGTGVPGTTFKDAGLTNGQTFYYVVSSANSFGVSPPSSPVQGTPQVKAVKVAASASVTLALLADGTVSAWGSNDGSLLGDPVTLPQSNTGVEVNLTGVIDIAATEDVGMALLVDGTVWTWGKNIAGTLGNGTTTPSLAPVQAQTPPGVVRIAGQGRTALAITGSGDLWGWGSNNKGLLGLPLATTAVSTPVQIAGLSNVVAASVSTAGDACLAVTADGLVWGCGNNAAGQLGDGSTNSRTTFAPVVNLTGVVAVAGGYEYSVALDSNGIVWTWGTPGTGTNGLGHAAGPLPTPIPGLTAIRQIAAGESFTIAMRVDGTVWGTGSNTAGTLGNPAAGNQTTAPVQASISDVRSIAASREHVLAIDAQGLLWGWGYNRQGALGTGEAQQVFPGPADSLTQVVDAVICESGGMATRSDHSLWSWGSGFAGSLGDGTNTGQTGLRVRVNQSLLTNPVALAANNPGRFGVDASGSVYFWGGGGGLQGTGNLLELPKTTPTKVNGLPACTLVANGGSTAYAITTTGTVYGWGVNAGGVAGIGGGNIPITPTQLPNLAGIKAIAAGDRWGMALTTTGVLWGWGHRIWSPILPVAQSPVQIGGLPTITAIAAAPSFALLAAADGTVWGFGSGPYGVLGVNGGPGPTQVAGLSSIQSVAAGAPAFAAGGHGLALRTDGTVLAWGANFGGELGNGRVSTTGTTPAPVLNLPGPAIKVSAGGRSSLAVLADGTIWTWGENSLGQLANGSTGFTFSPVLISR